MMNRRICRIICALAVAGLANTALAQWDFVVLNEKRDGTTGPRDPSRSPMSLQEGQDSSGGTTESETVTTETIETTETTSTTETTDSGGFWIFPDQAPLTGRIITDRPGFSDSAALVPRGRFQIESGYTFTYDRESDRRILDHTFPELLFRTGLTEYLELRLGWAGASLTETLQDVTRRNRTHSHEDHNDGWRDTSIGVKVPILKDCENLPNISAIFTLGLPTGNPSKSTRDVSYELKFPMNYAVTDRFTVYGSVLSRFLNSVEGDGLFCQHAATLAGGYRVMDDLTLYLEYFGVYPANKNTDCAHILSAGPIIHLSDNVSLDMRAGVGLNEQAPDFQASVGFGIRF